MIRRRILTAVAVLMVAVSGLVGAAWKGNAYAAQTSSVGGNALKVSPVRQDITMDPGTKKTLSVFVTNVASVPATLHAAENDFVASSDESGKPSVILDEDKYAPSHSLKRFMVPIQDFTIGPGATKEVFLTINVPAGAAGGGYFGALRFQPAKLTSDQQLSLSGSVGSLILLKVNGAIKEQLSIESFDVQQKGKSGKFFTSNKNLKSIVRFRNEGNIQVAPFGKVNTMKAGESLSSDEINTTKPQGTVLPDSVRRFEMDLQKVGGFGRYTIAGNFGYGETGQLITAKTIIYVVPIFMIVLIALGILALLFLIFVLPRMIKSYNKRVIRKASRRR
jgi:hypothetical protein